MQWRLLILAIFVCSGLAAAQSVDLAKGLGDMQPEPPPTPTTESETKAKTDGDATTPAPSPSETPAPSPSPSPEPEKEAEPSPSPSPSPSPTPPPEPSATSKAMADKLYLGAGIGITSMKKDGDNYKSFFGSEVAIGYLTKTWENGLAWVNHFKYAAIDVNPRLEARDFRGIAEFYLLGSTFHYNLNGTHVTGLIELGAAQTALRTNDFEPVPNSAEGNGFMANLGGGATWQIYDKVTAGPSLRLGFGTYQVIQFAGTIEFFF